MLLAQIWVRVPAFLESISDALVVSVPQFTEGARSAAVAAGNNVGVSPRRIAMNGEAFAVALKAAEVDRHPLRIIQPSPNKKRDSYAPALP